MYTKSWLISLQFKIGDLFHPLNATCASNVPLWHQHSKPLTSHMNNRNTITNISIQTNWLSVLGRSIKLNSRKLCYGPNGRCCGSVEQPGDLWNWPNLNNQKSKQNKTIIYIIVDFNQLSVLIKMSGKFVNSKTISNGSNKKGTILLHKAFSFNS